VRSHNKVRALFAESKVRFALTLFSNNGRTLQTQSCETSLVRVQAQLFSYATTIANCDF